MSKVKRKLEKIFSGPGEEEQHRLAFGRRVHQIRAGLGLSQAEMSAQFGCFKNDTISRLERGEMHHIPFDIVVGLCRMTVQTGFTVEWLLTGQESQMRRVAADFITEVKRQSASPSPKIPAAQIKSYVAKRLVKSGYEIAAAESLPKDWRGRWVPVLGKVAAGAGIDTVEAESHPTGIADKYVRWDWKCENPAAVQVVGESMLPDFHPEDIVVFDLDVQVESGLAVVRFREKDEDLVRLKRLRRTRGRILLESLNPKFKTAELAPHRLVASWMVIDHLPFMREQQNVRPDR